MLGYLQLVLGEEHVGIRTLDGRVGRALLEVSPIIDEDRYRHRDCLDFSPQENFLRASLALTNTSKSNVYAFKLEVLMHRRLLNPSPRRIPAKIHVNFD
jgi:hypothetical protein